MVTKIKVDFAILLLAFLAVILLVDSPHAYAFTIEGNSVFVEDSQASLRVTPHTATSPVGDFRQNFELCNKTANPQSVYAAYSFDQPLSTGKVVYTKPAVFGNSLKE